MKTHENLLATVEALRSVREAVWQPLPYENRKGDWGMYFGFWFGEIFHGLSVHSYYESASPRKLAHLVEGIERIDEEKWGIYANRKDVPGFYATGQSERLPGHWFMIGRSKAGDYSWLLRQKSRLTEDEAGVLEYFDRRRSKKEMR